MMLALIEHERIDKALYRNIDANCERVCSQSNENRSKTVLAGQTTRLLDEWQAYPQIGSYVRREMDERRQKGQFILTGSDQPYPMIQQNVILASEESLF